MILTDTLVPFFLETRNFTEVLCEPLEIEDYVVQPIVDVSPPKWHLGHSTWFFEEFILKPHAENYQVFDTDFSFVFNSYYETVGKRVVRSDRGNLSRPSVQKVYEYRSYVNNAIQDLFKVNSTQALLDLLEIGIHHEKQHQELLLSDIKYILGNNPLLPSYAKDFNEHTIENHAQDWIRVEKGIYEIGHNSDEFCYDNELGRHKVYLHGYQISNKLITNSEFIAFITAGGYHKFDLWHAEGWDWVQQQQITAPLYWHQIDGKWHHYTLSGLQEVEPQAPVTHISYYEAFAFAQWKGCRLPGMDRECLPTVPQLCKSRWRIGRIQR